MTQGPDQPDPDQPDPGRPPGGQPPPPPYGQHPQGQPPHGQPPYAQPPFGQAPYGQAPYGQPPYGQPYPGAPYGPPGAPYGVHPVTGVPYSDKSKLAAGLLQILLPFGIGRFYIGDTTTGVLQLVVTLLTCGLGGLWPFIDGIVILATDNVSDAQGRPLRPS